ncbi:MAG: hydrolase 2, exosortase A system-associated [Methylomonas sp.]
MKPFYLPDRSGSLFCIYFPPATGEVKRAIVHVQAFAEEMNKSRRMVSLQARELAKLGYATLIFDLFGTGDSDGEFGEATWQAWLQNIDTAIEWLIKQQGAQTIDLWGLRTGALLAMDYASRSHQKIDRLLCWQPVLNGETFITQFLRLRIAAAVLDNSAPKEKTSDLKRQLLEGQAIEVAGYHLHPELVKPLTALRADRLPLQGLSELAIFEVVANEETDFAMTTSQFLDKAKENSIEVSLKKVVGDAFWSTQEITAAPDLIALTNNKVEQ